MGSYRPGNKHTAVLYCTVDDHERTIAYREIYASKTNSHEIAEEIKRLNKENDENITAYYLDPQGRFVGSALQNTVDIAAQFFEEGINVSDWPRTRSTGGKIGQVDIIRKLLSDDKVLVSKDCLNLIREMSTWSYKKGLTDYDSSDKFERGGDHLIDCLAGFCSMKKTHTPAQIGYFDIPMSGKPQFVSNDDRPADDQMMAGIIARGQQK